MPEKEAMAPAVATAQNPFISPQARQPAVTSKKPVKKAFAAGILDTAEKICPSKTSSRVPQARMINAHIRKQLSAAETTDSITQEALDDLSVAAKSLFSSGFSEKNERKTAIIAADKNCAAKRRKPIFR